MESAVAAPEKMGPRWRPDATALDALDERGGPFQTRSYRAAWASAQGLRDQSYGARLPDGATAAIALTRVSPFTVSSPPLGYGGVISSRTLSAPELRAFLSAARRAARVPLMDLLVLGREIQGTGRVVGTTRIVSLESDPVERFEKKGRQSVRRAIRAGGEVERTSDVSRFLDLYRPVALARGVEYPAEIIRRLAADGCCDCYDVLLEGRAVSSLLVLRGPQHWMYWAAAQDDRGRKIEAGYLALATMLEDAFKASAGFVNLGASRSGGQDLDGVDRIKRRLGSHEEPIVEIRSGLVDPRVLRAPARIAQRLRR